MSAVIKVIGVVCDERKVTDGLVGVAHMKANSNSIVAEIRKFLRIIGRVVEPEKPDEQAA